MDLPDEKVIKALIFGVKSSGNQSERGLQEIARISACEYPEVNDIVQKDIYVVDYLPGEREDQLELVLNRRKFSLKSVTFSGKDQPTVLSADDSSINVAGMKWFPRMDLLSLDVSELNFAKKFSTSKRYFIKVNKKALCVT